MSVPATIATAWLWARAMPMFVNNRTTLHARTKFENGNEEDGKRHLMRLWLDVPGKRPNVPEIQVYDNAGGRCGIDPQEGKARAGAHYRTATEILSYSTQS